MLEMSKPLVSICIPCFNAEAYVGATIESVLAQTYSPIEVIVADDGSSDQSAAVIASYQPHGVRLVSTHHCGASAARNLAFAGSSGRFVLFLDADDLIDPNHVEALAAQLETADRRVAFGRWLRFTDKPTAPIARTPEHYRDMPGFEWLCRDWMDGAPMSQCGMFLIPRVLIEEHGGWDERLSLIDDLEFFARIVSRSDGVTYAAQACLHYRAGVAGSLSRQASRKAFESAVLSCLLAFEHVLSVEDSAWTRSICANLLQAFEYHFYPIFSGLSKRVRARVAELGGSDIEPKGPAAFHFLRRWIGWRAARRFQRLVNAARHIASAARRNPITWA